MRTMLLAAAAVLLLPLAARAADVSVIWSSEKQDGAATLSGQPDEEESDRVLFARCRADGRIDLGVGAYESVGEGKGEAVSVTLSAGGKNATLHGKSQNSPNFEMTAGTELATTVTKDDPVFAVFMSGQPVTIRTGATARPDRWSTKGLPASAQAFLAACGAKRQ